MKKSLLLLTPVLFLTACAVEGERYYTSDNPEECSVIRFQCQEGAKPFSDDTGCGCIVPEGIRSAERHYLSSDATVCSENDFVCDAATKPFSDETGCGCEEMTEEEKAAQAEMMEEEGMNEGDEMEEPETEEVEEM